MQRYFVSPERMSDRAVTLTGEDARHFARVLRGKPGDRFIACDGTGRDALAEATRVGPDAVEADVVRFLAESNEPPWAVTVAQSLPKGDKMEVVIQKGTETGAAAFWPFVSRRTVVEYDGAKEARRLVRWRKIAKEAAEQAHRSAVPEVAPVMEWKELLARFPFFDLVLFCYEEEGRRGLRTVLAEHRERLAGGERPGVRPRLLLVIGPEGGFTAEEAEEAARAGAVWTGLGPRTLRTETAAPAALACLAYESGEMGR
ncbi:MAG TPA: 16S rRNA (uracil(1498)-N(3))-methyltransferase [Paenibacillaceae bacterium]